MTRKYLQGLGIETDIIDKIMQENGSDIEREKGVAETLKEEIKQLKVDVSNTQKKFDEYKSAQPDPKSIESKETEYQTKIKEIEAAHKEALKVKDTEYQTKIKEYDAQITQYETDKVNTTKMSMLERHLLAAGAKAKYVKKIANDFDISKLEIDGDKFKDFDKALEEVKPSWSDMFGETMILGTDPANPPAQPSQSKYTMEQIKTMTSEQINANWDKGVKQALESSAKK